MHELTLPAALESLPPLTELAYRAALQCGLDERSAWQVQLAVDEAVTNIIQHAYQSSGAGEIRLSCRCEAQAFVVVLRDYGLSYDPSAVEPPDLVSPIEERRTGGLGLYLMQQLMDQVEYHANSVNGNELVMLKLRHAALPADVRILPLSGRIDAFSAPQMADQVRSAIADGGRRLILDFGAVTFLSSSGLRTLLIIARELKTLGGQIRLCALPPQIAEVVQMTGFDRLFPIHEGHKEALAAFSSD